MDCNVQCNAQQGPDGGHTGCQYPRRPSGRHCRSKTDESQDSRRGVQRPLPFSSTQNGDGNVWTRRGAVAIVFLSIMVLRSGCGGLVLAGTNPAEGAAPPAQRTDCQTASFLAPSRRHYVFSPSQNGIQCDAGRHLHVGWRISRPRLAACTRHVLYSPRPSGSQLSRCCIQTELMQLSPSQNNEVDGSCCRPTFLSFIFPCSSS